MLKEIEDLFKLGRTTVNVLDFQSLLTIQMFDVGSTNKQCLVSA